VDSSPDARITVSDLLGMQHQVKNRYLGNSSAKKDIFSHVVYFGAL